MFHKVQTSSHLTRMSIRVTRMNCFSENRGRDIFVELLITAAKDSSDCKITNLKGRHNLG